MTRLWTLLFALSWAGALSTAAAAPEAAVPSPFSATASDPIDRGLFWLYQLQYDRALAAFDASIENRPEDPAGYFYKAATDWWHLAQNFDYKLPEIEARFYRNIEDTIQKAKALAASSADPRVKALAYLYRGGAEGLRGRWLVAQKEWVSAYFAGRNGDHFLKLAIRYDPTLYDAYMGLGIYDYFTDTLGGVQKVLAAILVRGDRARGLRELQTAIEKSRHARVESMVFLIEIYSSEERKPELALPLTRALRREFPQSPMAHLAEIMTLYGLRRWPEVKSEAQVFLERSEREVPYYTQDGVRPALYCLGVAELWGDNDVEKAEGRFKSILASGEDSSRWVTFAYLRLGQIADLRGDRPQAIAFYRRVLSRADFWGSRREAEAYLKKPFKRDV
jgi:tetratricopeptide (TPR) repeat protein